MGLHDGGGTAASIACTAGSAAAVAACAFPAAAVSSALRPSLRVGTSVGPTPTSASELARQSATISASDDAESDEEDLGNDR
jgi:hypothetical protein